MLGFRGLALNYTEFLILSPSVVFFFNDTATTEIYTLSLHDALPISTRFAATICSIRSARTLASASRSASRSRSSRIARLSASSESKSPTSRGMPSARPTRSEEHTSELQSQSNLVCRLLLEKKKNQ